MDMRRNGLGFVEETNGWNVESGFEEEIIHTSRESCLVQILGEYFEFVGLEMKPRLARRRAT